MKIAVFGTGSVGQTLAARLHELGHDVALGTRDPDATRARTERDGMGNPPVSAWLLENPDIALESFADAATGADLVVNAANGEAALEVLAQAGTDHLAGKVLLDLTNPLDFSQGFPPSLSVSNTDSLGEQIQRHFPLTRVVKALNTLTAALMVHPEQLGAESTVFVSGDDPEAKALVTELLTSLGHTDVMDLGDITTARGSEMYLPLWLRVMGALGTAGFNIKVVR